MESRLWFSCSIVSDSCNSMDYSPPGSSIHRISQARFLDWVAIPFSRGSSQPQDWTHVSCIGRKVLYHWAIREVQYGVWHIVIIVRTGIPVSLRDWGSTGSENTLPVCKDLVSGKDLVQPTLYAGWKQQLDWFQIGKGVHKGCILSPCLFNLYAEYIMRNAGLEEAQAGIRIARRKINNLRYADDTTLMAESGEELKSLLMKVKVESEQVGLKHNIQKTNILASGLITSW